MALQLRYYQEDSITNVMTDLERGFTRVIVKLPTGTGKSAVQNNIVKRHYPVQKHRTLFMGGMNVHLNYQGYAGFKREYPDCGHLIEKGGRMRPGIGMVMDSENAADARIVVASFHTVAPKYLKSKTAIEREKLKPEDVVMRDGGIFLAKGSKRKYLISPRMDEILAHGYISCAIIDECHHAASDGMVFLFKQMMLIHEFLGLPKLHIVGFTATVKRVDNRSLGVLFEKESYAMSYDDAILEGWLAPLSEDLDTVEIIGGADGPQDEEEEIAFPELLIEEPTHDLTAIKNWEDSIIKAYQEKAAGRYAVAYVGPINGMRSVIASRALSRAFNKAGIPSVHVDADFWVDFDDKEQPNSKREEMFALIAQGKVKVTCNYNVLIEGVDCPIWDCILLARSVNEVSLTQILGRVLRLYKGNTQYGIPEKIDAKIIDFTGQELVLLTHSDLAGKKKVDPFAEPLPLETGDEPENIIIQKKREGGFLRDMVPFGHVFGGDNVYHPLKLARSSPHVWFMSNDGWMSMSIGEQSSLIITQPKYELADKYLRMMELQLTDDDRATVEALYSIFSNFAVWHIKDGEVVDGEAKRLSPALDETMFWAGKYAEESPEFAGVLSKKKQSWRSPSEPASGAQLWKLGTLYPKLDEFISRRALLMPDSIPMLNDKPFISKNLASQMINHEISRKVIQDLFDTATSVIAQVTA